MKKTFIVTMLAVVAFATNVFATEAEAGVLDLKPSANQNTASSSGSNNVENRDVQNIQYDTGKYRYPAQQLVAENRQFDKYNWRLYQRFDTGELMLQDWLNSINWRTREYSNNTFHKNDASGIRTFEFDLREDLLAYYDKEFILDGLRMAGTDNHLQFARKDSLNDDIPVRMNLDVHIKPEHCYPEGTDIVVPGATSNNGAGEPFSVYQDAYWYGRGTGQIKGEAINEFNAKYGHSVDPIKLYYPSVGRALYISGWSLDDIAKYMPIIDSVYLDENPENRSHYTYMLHHKLRNLPGMEQVI